MFKEDPKLSNIYQGPSFNMLERLITDKATNEYGLFPNKNWIEKCIQIHAVSNTFKGTFNFK